MTGSRAQGVLFDVGYTLLDETPRLDGALRWLAGYLSARGVPVTAARLADLYREACLAPRQGIGGLLVQTALAAGAGEDLARAQRRAMPWDSVPMPPYPGALEALRALRQAGFRVGVLANQPASAQGDLERAGLSPWLDDVWLSESVGLEKPDPAFFRLALAHWRLPAERVAYVGDRPDNDVAPARALGMYAVRVLLGPHAHEPVRSAAEHADHEARSLPEAADHLVQRARGSGSGTR
jgi:HAD superfamily hydrolase (TIGR01509 family)